MDDDESGSADVPIGRDAAGTDPWSRGRTSPGDEPTADLGLPPDESGDWLWQVVALDLPAESLRGRVAAEAHRLADEQRLTLRHFAPPTLDEYDLDDAEAADGEPWPDDAIELTRDGLHVTLRIARDAFDDGWCARLRVRDPLRERRRQERRLRDDRDRSVWEEDLYAFPTPGEARRSILGRLEADWIGTLEEITERTLGGGVRPPDSASGRDAERELFAAPAAPAALARARPGSVPTPTLDVHDVATLCPPRELVHGRPLLHGGDPAARAATIAAFDAVLEIRRAPLDGHVRFVDRWWPLGERCALYPAWRLTATDPEHRALAAVPELIVEIDDGGFNVGEVLELKARLYRDLGVGCLLVLPPLGDWRPWRGWALRGDRFEPLECIGGRLIDHHGRRLSFRLDLARLYRSRVPPGTRLRIEESTRRVRSSPPRRHA